MRLALAPLAILPLLTLTSASLATESNEIFKWASSLVTSDNGGASTAKNGEVHTMDSWSYVDCGTFKFAYSPALPLCLLSVLGVGRQFDVLISF